MYMYIIVYMRIWVMLFAVVFKHRQHKL